MPSLIELHPEIKTYPYILLCISLDRKQGLKDRGYEQFAEYSNNLYRDNPERRRPFVEDDCDLKK
jgi:hypothetical protein